VELENQLTDVKKIVSFPYKDFINPSELWL